MKKLALLFVTFFIILIHLEAANLFPIKQNGKWGYINSSGEIKIVPEFEAADYFDNNEFAKIQKNGLVGLIDSTGNILIQPAFENIRIFKNNLIGIYKEGSWGVMTTKGEIITNIKIEDFRYNNDGNIFYIKNNKYGLINSSGKIVCVPEFDSLSLAQYNFLYAKKDSLSGLYDKNGKVILPCLYEKLSIQSADRIFICLDHQWGLADSKGKIIINPAWDELTWMTENYFKLRKDTLFTVFDVNAGRNICNLTGLNFKLFEDDYFLTYTKGLYGLMNGAGLEILKPVYQDIAYGMKNCIVVRQNGKCGLVDFSGRVMISPRYDFILSFDKHVAMTSLEKKYGLINDRGDILEEPKYESMSIYEGVIKARQNESLKVIELDESGNPYDVTSYENAKTFHVGRRDNTSYRMVNSGNNDKINSLGWFYSSIDKKYGLRNSKGEIVIWPAYDRIYIRPQSGLTLTEISNVQTDYRIGNATFHIKSKFGIVDHVNCKIIAPAEYLDIKVDDYKDSLKSLARCISISGQQGFLYRWSFNRFMPRIFVSSLNENMFRFCSRGKLILENKGASDEEIMSLSAFMKSFVSKWEPADEQTEKMVSDENTVLRCIDSFWGIAGEEEVILPPYYQFIKHYKWSNVVVKYKNKWGVINVDRISIVKANYDNIDIVEANNETYYMVSGKNSKYGLINEEGFVKVDPVYEDMGSTIEGFVRVKKDKKWGFIDTNGNVIGNIKYDTVMDFSDGMAAVKSGKLWGYIDNNGEEVIPFQFKEADIFSNGLAAVKSKAYWTYIDKSGKISIPLSLRRAKPFQEDVAWASLSGKLGLIDKKGNWIIKQKFSTAEKFDSNNLSVVSRKGSYGLINKRGEIVSSFKFDKIYPFTEEGLAMVVYKGKTGYMDKSGNLLIKPKFIKGFSFSQGYSVVLTNTGYGLIDVNGVFTSLNSLQRIFSYENGLAGVVSRNGKVGSMDLEQNISLFNTTIVKVKFSNGKAIIPENSEYYFIDQWGNKLFDKKFQAAREFYNNRAIVKSNNHWGIINDNGNFVVTPKFGEIKNFTGKFAAFRQDSFYGIIDLNGKTILEAEFDYINYCGKDLFRVERNNKIGYIDRRGNWIWEMQM